MSDITLTARINTLIITAMKAKDAGRLGPLRMLKAAIMNRGVEKGRDLDDTEVLQVVSQLVKQRRDSIEQFAAAGRQDLVEKETAELTILGEFQPPAASAVEIEAADGVGGRRRSSPPDRRAPRRPPHRRSPGRC